MGGINDYLNGIKRQYPDTEEVREQIEELRDTLHLKTEEYQSMGRTYNEAVSEAIESMGDLSSLLDQVSGNTRSVYINRLNRDNTFYCVFAIIMAYLLGWLAYLLSADMGGYMYIAGFVTVGVLLCIVLGMWLMVINILYKRQKDKIRTVMMPYKKLMRVTLFVWCGLSLMLFIIDMVNLYDGMWFMWPVLGIANWPISIWMYHRLLTSGKYDAPILNDLIKRACLCNSLSAFVLENEQALKFR